MDVLVLSPQYEPIGLITWQRAMTLLSPCVEAGEVVFGNQRDGARVEVIREYEDKVIQGATWKVTLPAVVRYYTGAFEKRWRRRCRFSRNAILQRDNFSCQYCGVKVSRDLMTYDHVTPVSRGGATIWQNVVTACMPCNHKKGSRTPEEAKMKLRKQPVEPKWLPGTVFAPALKNGVPVQWKDFLGHLEAELRDALYWNDELEP